MNKVGRLGTGEAGFLEKPREELTKNKKQNCKCIVWNIAGIKDKDNDFWEYISEFDVGLIETWLKEKDWNTMKERLPKGYIWYTKYATRNNKKRRASGGLLLGIKERWDSINQEEDRPNRITRKIKIDKETWIFRIMYNRYTTNNKKVKMLDISEEEDKHCKIIIAEDFNARTGREGGVIDREGII